MKGHRLITLSGAALVGVALFGLLPGGTVRGVAPKAAAMLYCQPNIFVDGTPGMSVRVVDTSSGPTIAVGAPCAESLAALLNAGFLVTASSTPDFANWTYTLVK